MESILRDEAMWYLPSLIEMRGPGIDSRSSILYPPKTTRPTPNNPSASSSNVVSERLTTVEWLDKEESAWQSLIPRMVRSRKVLVPGQVHKPNQDKSIDYSEAVESDDDDDDDDDDDLDSLSGNSTPSSSSDSDF